MGFDKDWDSLDWNRLNSLDYSHIHQQDLGHQHHRNQVDLHSHNQDKFHKVLLHNFLLGRQDNLDHHNLHLDNNCLLNGCYSVKFSRYSFTITIWSSLISTAAVKNKHLLQVSEKFTWDLLFFHRFEMWDYFDNTRLVLLIDHHDAWEN